MLHDLLQYISPEYIITVWGVAGILGAIFAETWLLFWLILPGDSLLFTTGIMISAGILKIGIWHMLRMSMIAWIVGDFVGYMFGRFSGKKLATMKKTFYYKPEYLTYAQEFYKKYDAMAIVFGRFIPIARTLVPMVAGLVKMDYHKFVIYNIAWCILWVWLFVGGGYMLGERFPMIKDHVELIALIIVLVSLAPLIRKGIANRKK